MFSAGLRSRLLIFAWACGLRRIMPCSMPGRLMSKEYFALPVALSGPSIRLTLVPSNRRFSGHLVAMILAPLLGAQLHDGVPHLLVGAAAADVAAQADLDLGGVGVGVLVERGP